MKLMLFKKKIKRSLKGLDKTGAEDKIKRNVE